MRGRGVGCVGGPVGVVRVGHFEFAGVVIVIVMSWVRMVVFIFLGTECVLVSRSKRDVGFVEGVR